MIDDMCSFFTPNKDSTNNSIIFTHILCPICCTMLLILFYITISTKICKPPFFIQFLVHWIVHPLFFTILFVTLFLPFFWPNIIKPDILTRVYSFKILSKKNIYPAFLLHYCSYLTTICHSNFYQIFLLHHLLYLSFWPNI